ncbi:hypothetical protein GVI01_11260 [Escherichia coli]|uniref:Uncharacterized protein n=1 Tax=Klebsiella pneumoniae TaxID=573 RepID=A0A486V6S1_KLEPN|nr:hypothetical protein [Klebsiella pneumoniae]MBE9778663.1 hypothetical protein [Escherichia coli]MDE8480424.1 hypothetical protein [Klebsiella pneumoniae]VGK03711.1 Uncharacterised protein [Klebsiella pneumoniae]VGM46500.1 Uncharacterised protein [Klebsiella pneumoniae]HBU7483790.1 hypothetical protein [Klebsiella pneumoniae]
MYQILAIVLLIVHSTLTYQIAYTDKFSDKYFWNTKAFLESHINGFILLILLLSACGIPILEFIIKGFF